MNCNTHMALVGDSFQILQNDSTLIYFSFYVLTMGNTRSRVNTESHMLPTFDSESSSDSPDTDHSDDEKLAFIDHVMSTPCDMRQMFLNVSKPTAPRSTFKAPNHYNDECIIKKLWIYSNVSHLWVCHVVNCNQLLHSFIHINRKRIL